MDRQESIPYRLRVVVLFVGILALAAAAKVAAADAAIEARNYEFVEPAVTISVGDTVTWTFSGALHSVTSGDAGAPDDGFNSGLVSEGRDL